MAATEVRAAPVHERGDRQRTISRPGCCSALLVYSYASGVFEVGGIAAAIVGTEILANASKRSAVSYAHAGQTMQTLDLEIAAVAGESRTSRRGAAARRPHDSRRSAAPAGTQWAARPRCRCRANNPRCSWAFRSARPRSPPTRSTARSPPSPDLSPRCTGSGNPSLASIAIVVIGGALLSGERGHMLGTMLGILVFGTIQSAILFDGRMNPWWIRIVVGVLLLAFILLQRATVRSAVKC
jgi:hypothetical protein